MYNQTVYSCINYDQQLERQIPSLPGPAFSGPSGSGLPGLPGLSGSQPPTAPPPSFIPQQW